MHRKPYIHAVQYTCILCLECMTDFAGKCWHVDFASKFWQRPWIPTYIRQTLPSIHDVEFC
jgi:hypothetical protein